MSSFFINNLQKPRFFLSMRYFR